MVRPAVYEALGPAMTYLAWLVLAGLAFVLGSAGLVLALKPIGVSRSISRAPERGDADPVTLPLDEVIDGHAANVEQ